VHFDTSEMALLTRTLDAHKAKLPVIVAVLPEATMSRFESHLTYPEYRLEGTAQISGIEGGYGRVFVFVNPSWLNPAPLAARNEAYFHSLYTIAVELPNRIALVDFPSVQAAVTNLAKQIETLHEPEKVLRIETGLGDIYRKIGQGPHSRELYAKAKGLARGLPDAEWFLEFIQWHEDHAAPYREVVSSSASSATETRGREIVGLGIPGETPSDDQRRLNVKAFWLDFSPPVHVPSGSMLRIETTLTRGDVQGIRLLTKQQDFAVKGYMEVLPFSSGRQAVYLRIDQDIELSRLDDQVGPNAWGFLGGRLDAVSSINSVKDLDEHADDDTSPR
jgi:hypothetical protein